MALMVKHLLDHASHALGGGALPVELDGVGILNQAGEHLYSMHPWRWAQGRSTLLNLRGTVSGTDASWNSGTLTLTSTGAFTDYTFVEGDEVQITDGTGITEGFYTVASRTSANAIVLESSIGSTATDVDFTLQPYTIDLPDDLRDIISIVGTEIDRHVTLSTLEEVLRAREQDEARSHHWYGAVSYVGSPPSPVLEIGPGAGSNVTGALRLFYRSRWTRLTADSTTVDVPEFVEALLTQIVRAFARGYTREDEASLDVRLAEIQAGPVFMVAKRSDGNIQPSFGKLTGGGAQVWRRRRYGEFYEITSRVDGPI